MKKVVNHQAGWIISTLGALMGVIGHYLIFDAWYFKGMAAESAEPGCEILLKYLQPALTDVGILGAVLLGIAAYGFYKERRWAFLMSIIGIVLALQSTWFINVPYMAAGLPPVYFIMFWPYVILYFLLMLYVGKLSWGRTLVGLLGGIVFVVTFMNGVSSLSRIFTIGAPLFVMTQRLHWIAMVFAGFFTIQTLLKPNEPAWVAGLTACVLELVVGVPLAITTSQELGRLSLFSIAPIGSVVLLIVLFWPRLWKALEAES